MKWAIELSDESLEPRWASTTAKYLSEPVAVRVRQMIYTNYLVVQWWQYRCIEWKTTVKIERLSFQPFYFKVRLIQEIDAPKS